MRKTSIAESIIPELSKIGEPTMKIASGKKTFRTITTEHVLQALTMYLSSMKMINANEHVTNIFKVPEGFDIKIEKMKED